MKGSLTGEERLTRTSTGYKLLFPAVSQISSKKNVIRISNRYDTIKKINKFLAEFFNSCI